MTAQHCPDGHESADADWCSVCGLPMGAPTTAPTPAVVAVPDPPPAAPAAPTKACPECGDANVGDALFCEDCGYDFTTGQKAPAPSSLTLDPPGAPAAVLPSSWVAEVWVDPGWFEANAETATDPCPAAGLPTVVPLHHDLVLVGRRSASKAIFPDIDCSADTGVSRRHAQLTLEQDRWYLEDLGSTNGTFVAAGDGSLPQTPIPPNRRQELGENERIYVGAWTRLVVRRATPAEGGA
jgi:uncharacterized protein (DUF983 family)